MAFAKLVKTCKRTFVRLKSHLPHQSELLKSRRYAVSEVFFLSNNGFGHYLVIILSFASSNNYAGFSTGIFVIFSRCIRFIILRIIAGRAYLEGHRFRNSLHGTSLSFLYGMSVQIDRRCRNAMSKTGLHSLDVYAAVDEECSIKMPPAVI